MLGEKRSKRDTELLLALKGAGSIELGKRDEGIPHKVGDSGRRGFEGASARYCRKKEYIGL